MIWRHSTLVYYFIVKALVILLQFLSSNEFDFNKFMPSFQKQGQIVHERAINRESFRQTNRQKDKKQEKKDVGRKISSLICLDDLKHGILFPKKILRNFNTSCVCLKNVEVQFNNSLNVTKETYEYFFLQKCQRTFYI